MVATRGFFRAIAALAVAASVLAGLLLADSALNTASAASSTVAIAGGPASPTVAPSGLVTVSAIITNSAATALTAGTLQLTPSSGALLTEDSLNTWLGGKGYNANPVTAIAVPALAAHASTSVSISVSARSLPQPAVWGVRGLLVTYSVGGKSLATLRSTVVLLAADAPAAVNLATVLPLVSPASALGLMTATEVASATASTGYLGQKLALAADAPVTLAVDPRITTSILALGTKAPATATAWLQSLSASAKTGFWLTYADSDSSGLIQSGSQGPLSPGIDDLANIPAPAQGTTWGGSRWPGWAPTLEGISWPIANTLSPAVVSKIATSGDTRILASTSNLSGTAPVTALGRVGVAKLVTVNAGATSCLQTLETANSTAGRASSTACFAARLAVAATSSPSGSTVVVALSRSSHNFTGGSFGAALAAVSQLEFTRPVTLDTVVSGASSKVDLVAQTESTSRKNALKKSLVNQAKIVAFAPVAQDQAVVINPGQRRLAAISSAAWITEPDWNSGLEANSALTSDVLGSVSIVTSSTINMVSGQARIPVVVRNDLESAVSVTVHAMPSNARISVGSDVPLNIEASSQARAYLPVTARVGNGGVTLEVSLTDSAGARVGAVANLPVNVRADWETFGLWGLATVFFALIIAGVIRTVRRNKRKADAQ